jgi:hypothetical protein
MRDRRGEKSRDCERAACAIEDFADGGIGRARWMLLRRHVAGCQDCATYFDRMGAVVEALAGMQGVKAPDDFAAIVMHRLLAGLAASRPEPDGKGYGRGTLVWVAAAGVGVAVAVGLAVARWALGREASEKLAAAGSA